MKTTWTWLWVLFLLFLGLWSPAQAGQQIYLSESPNGRYRVIIEQVIDRRVEEKVFFRYTLDLLNARRPKHHFEIFQGGSPLVQETDKGTFKVHWESIHFDWAKDSLKFFVRLEVIEGTWKTYFVDINSGKTTDITADLEAPMSEKIASKEWDCQQPTMEAVKWTKPYLAFIKLTATCSKDKTQPTTKAVYLTDSLLFDALQAKVVSHCMDCKEEKALKTFDKYFISTIPTPTPTPEETPTVQ